MASAQKCGGVQKKITIKNQNAVQESDSVTAAQPIKTGKQPAIPPQTMFCEVRRFSPTVYPKT